MNLARSFFVFITAILATSAHSSDTVLSRVDGEVKLILRADSTYAMNWLESGSVNQGVYEAVSCWNSMDDSRSGNHMFYTADGDSCCIEVRNIGNKMLLKFIAGYEYNICNGGVFDKVND